MNIEEFLIEARVKIARKRKKKDALEEILLKSTKPEKIVDHLSPYELQELSKDVLKRKVDGYRNLYDYITKKHKHPFYYKKCDAGDIELGQILIDNMGIFTEGYLTDEVLLSTMPNGQMALDVALKKIFFFEPKVTTIALAKELIKRNKYDLLKNVDGTILKEEIFPNKTLFEDMIEHKVIPNINYVTIDKRGNFGIDGNILFENIKDDKRVIDYLLESDLNVSFNTSFMPKDLQLNIAKACIEHEKYEPIKIGHENFFTQKIKFSNGHEISIFRKLIINNVEPLIIDEIKDTDIIETYLFSKENTNTLLLIDKCSVETLTSTVSNTSSTVLDWIIFLEFEKIHNKKEDFLTIGTNNLSLIIKTLYVKNKLNSKVALILAKNGLFFSPIDNTKNIGVDKDEEIQKYIFKEVRIPTQKEHQELIDRFRMVYGDDESNPEIIEDIISSFNETVLINEEETIRDMEALITYKEENKKFRIIYDPSSGSSFLAARDAITSEGKIKIDKVHDIYSLTHEWGHLIHETYAEQKTPDNIKELIPYDYSFGWQNEQEVHNLFKKVDEEAQELFQKDKIYQEFTNFINQQKGSIELYKDEIRAEYKDLIGTDKILIEALKDKTMSIHVKHSLVQALNDKAREYFLANEYIEKYVEERLKAEFEKFAKISYEKNNSEFLCYENFIDAYYGGALGDASGHYNTNVPICTHNVEYFLSNHDRQFAEMFANFVELKKARIGSKYIEKLKEKTSPELISAIEIYYKNLGREKKHEIK